MLEWRALPWLKNLTLLILWDILFMAPRIKLIVIFNLLWSKFVETNATFRSASTDL